GANGMMGGTTDGASQTTLVSSLPACSPITIAVSGSLIDWATANNIPSAPIAGGSATSRTNPNTTLTRLAIDGTNLYTLGGTSLIRYALSDFSGGTLTISTAGQTASHALAFDATYVYFAGNASPTNLPRLVQ